MTSSWSTSLAHLEIRNMALVSIGDVPDKVTRGLLETSLMSLTKLKTLVLEGKSQQGCIPLDLRALPDSIESLELKHFVLMDKGIEGRRAPEGRELMRTRPIFRSMRAFFPNLSKLSLSACSVVDGKTWDLTKVLSIASSSVRTERINEALDREAMEDFFRLGLPGLITLRDLNLHQLDALSDRHLVNFSSLTRLTSLSIHTLSNPKVNHSSLPIVIGAAPTLVGSLQGLPKMRHLQRLSWFVGDLLDELMPISCLSALPRLYTFSVPTNLYYRIQRWHRDVESCLPPYCELETV